MEREQGELLFKTSCECGSSDARAVYSTNTSYCFSCGTHFFTDEQGNVTNGKVQSEEVEETNEDFVSLEFRSLEKRKISEKTCRRFGYGINNQRQVATYYDKDGKRVAQKFRTKDKKFSWVGQSKNSTLFGQNLIKPNPKLRIVLTEGEIDALSIAEIQDNKYPVVSVPNGAAAAVKDVKRNLEYLMGFDKVIICFDMDEVGQEAAKKVAQLFPPKKAAIVSMEKKDANEMLVAGLESKLILAIANAKPYTPDGILSGESIIQRLLNKPKTNSYEFPEYMSDLNKMLKGIRMGELGVFAAGTGSGKTTFIKTLQHHVLRSTELNQGIIHLEEPLIHTAEGMVGLELGVRLHMDNELESDIIIDKAKELFNMEDTEGNKRIHLYDAFGSMAEDDLYSKIRFMVNGLGCKVIWLDHLSILVSDLDGSADERRTIDKIMHNLKSLTIELNCFIGLIVHLNNATGEGLTFEQGKRPSLNNLRGSGGIKQLADFVLAMTRDQQTDNRIKRNTTELILLKCRFTGETGFAGKVYYNSVTGRLGLVPSEEPIEDNNGSTTQDF